MEITTRGEFTIAVEEGIVPTRYRDKVGVDTWGIGHTAAAGDPDPRGMSYRMPTNIDGVVAEAIKVFGSDIDRYSDEIVARFGPMRPHELDGWTSWHFNTGGAYSSRAVNLWKSGQRAEAVRVLTTWNKVTRNGTKTVSGALKKRRAIEADIILKGKYPEAVGIPIWGTDGKGSVIWKALDYVTFEEYEKATGRAGPAIPVAPAAGAAAAAIGIAAALAAFWDQIKEFFTWM